MSSALAATTGGSKSSGRMPDLSLVEAAAVAATSPTRSEAEEDEELNAAAAEAVRNLRSPKSDEEEMDEVRDENGRHSERRCEDDDDDRKGLKDEIDNGENKEKQVSQSVSLLTFFVQINSSLARVSETGKARRSKSMFASFVTFSTENKTVRCQV